MPVTRNFLGWDRPALHTAAAWMCDRYRRGDALEMKNITVAIPVARAGRRLRELLLAAAEENGLRLVPPRVVTVGALAESLYEPEGENKIADDLARGIVWAQALRDAPPQQVERLIPYVPAPGDWPGWLALAEDLDMLHTELAGECLTFADAAGKCGEMGYASEAERWEAAERVRVSYLKKLGELGLCDPQQVRREAVEQKKCAARGEVVLIASDLTMLQKRMLGSLREEVTSLIFAPQSLADAFDAMGSIVPEKWAEARIEIKDARIAMVDRPADQAAEVVTEIASYAGKFAADEVSVGVPDATLSPYVEQALTAHRLPVRDTLGRAVSRSGPFRFLAAAADYLEHARFADLASLARHPDVEKIIQSSKFKVQSSEGVDDWLTVLDDYYSDHLQGKLSGHWLGRPERRERMKAVHDAVQSLLKPLAGGPLPLREWAEKIASVLRDLYSTETSEVPTFTAEACQVIGLALQSLRDLPEKASPRVAAAVAIRLLLKQIERERIEPEPGEPAVELLGWLELSLDDAPALIVTGFNEGNVPESVSSDPYLPNTLREKLGLRDNTRRYARDAYLLSAILASRPGTKLICGRWSVEEEPRMVSRLLLACGEEILVARVERFCGESADARRDHNAAKPAPVSAFQCPPPLPLPLKPVERINVTAFADYLACPYRFYLKHVLKLGHMDDTAEEMDGGAFGNLAHDVLASFGKSEVKDSSDHEAIAKKLDALLDEHARAAYGSDAPAAVRVQVEQLRARLADFAVAQAVHVQEGWRIRHVEVSFRETPYMLDLGGETIPVDGRVDRIDFNTHTGEYAVFDYKTGDKAENPEEAHRDKQGQWTNLQLPLYRNLAVALRIASPKVGYILLPKEKEKCGFVFAEWSEEDLRSAEGEARRIARLIRAGEFKISDEPQKYDDFAEICGVSRMQSAALIEGEEEAE